MLTHEQARFAVSTVINIISMSPRLSELELVSALEREGFSHLHAEKLCIFVPSAFAWALLKQMGLQSFPSYYVAFDRFGKEIEQPIAREHYFTAALQAGVEAEAAKLLPLRVFRIAAEVANEDAVKLPLI
jgi:hypothetical protein